MLDFIDYNYSLHLYTYHLENKSLNIFHKLIHIFYWLNQSNFLKEGNIFNY